MSSPINFSDALSIWMGFMSSPINLREHSFPCMVDHEFSSPVNFHECASTCGYHEGPHQLQRGLVHICVYPLHGCWIHERCQCPGCHQMNMGAEEVSMCGVT